MSKSLILLELNEINFDVVRTYLNQSPGCLPAFSSILAGTFITTEAESDYENLEPWIQWPSVHTGLTYNEHDIFRLGDIVSSDAPQFFEVLEHQGLKVGAVSPMNAANRLENPAYFLPDPWTKTKPDDSWWSRRLSEVVSQAVNDNATSTITLKNKAYLILGLIRFCSLRDLKIIFGLVKGSKRAPWRRALVLDVFLNALHREIFRKYKPDFSVLFLNAGAHIQHHYFFNSSALNENVSQINPSWYVDKSEDPVLEMLKIYDAILAERLKDEGSELIVATGLSQKPYDSVKFYYRLRDHKSFLNMLGIECLSVEPRMTRDFLIVFDSEHEALLAKAKLEAATIENSDIPVFGLIDNRGMSLFVTLTYPREIDSDTKLLIEGSKPLDFQPLVAFVAIKNGMHQSKGFAYFSKGLTNHLPEGGSHVKNLNKSVLSYFSSI